MRGQRICKEMSRALDLCVDEGAENNCKELSRALVLCVGEVAENMQGLEQSFGFMCC